ncbi:Ribosomal protein S12p Asp88 (E. coli) methylthiotransferase [hydrothermal vent metagenome]|uniref:Ribosomal protein S12p Asp88 (E. coli) methylthiotransferase n=1 Tax=hydrothermal vent metagenome TaxID=652676 RepID=A0A3B1D7C1_9ZZZZ
MGLSGNFHILTLGCPKNRVDSETLLSLLTSRGFCHVNDAGEADTVLINTCGFIQAAKDESIEEILDTVSGKSNGQKVVVFGCLAQRYMEELKRELPEVDAFFGVNSHEEVLAFLETETSGTRNLQPATRNTGSYAYLKIADGCNRGCSFCAIPGIRGRFNSLSPDSIVQRAEELINSGTRELILVAQDITSYGREFTGYGLCELIEEITSLQGDFWLRLLYMYPTAIDEKLIATISGNEKVCKYLDIPLQHTEDRVLGLMKRNGSRNTYTVLINNIRKKIPDVTLRTSFILGFPSESDEEFTALLNFIREMEFERLGAFTYSREDGTPSYNLGDTIPEKEKERRYHELMMLQAGISLEKNRAMLDRVVRVLVDEVTDNIALCRYQGQAPEIDGMVIVNPVNNIVEVGDFINVRITEAYDYDLKGEQV